MEIIGIVMSLYAPEKVVMPERGDISMVQIARLPAILQNMQDLVTV